MDSQADSMLPVEALEKDLQIAEVIAANAASDAIRANEIFSHWQAVTTSLKTLIEARRKGANPPLAPSVMVPSPQGHLPAAEASNSGDGFVAPRDSGRDVNRVRWIEQAVAASGAVGMMPPEIFRAAEKEGLHMNKNYPYIVLRKLMEQERVIKRRGRYYKR